MIDSGDRTFASYRLEELLGGGGMGQVYRAVQIHLNRPAAVKIIHPELAPDLGSASQFLRLARQLADLDHPNIVKIYDGDVLNGRYFLVMELLPDGSLRSLWQGPTDTGRGPSHDESGTYRFGVDLVRQAAEGLAYAHTRGIIHGDVKPDNLLLKRAEDPSPSYTVKVADFGLAHLLEESAGPFDDVFLATPAYASPEQCQGREADALSDQYSLGVVLYEAVTGYLPFEARTLEEAVYKHSYLQPRPPRETVPDLPPALESIVLRCLAKRPQDRYPSMAELAGALRSAVEAMEKEGRSGAAIVHQPVPPDQRTTAPLPTSVSTIPPPDNSIPAPDPARTMPQLHLMDQSGNVFQSHDLSDKGLSVGRAADNNVVLDSPAVSRHHLRFDWNGKEATVTDRGSRHGTVLAGKRLEPNTPYRLLGSSWLQVAMYWLWLEVPPQAVPNRDVLLRESAVMAPPGSDRIHVSLDRPALTIVPGQPALMTVTVANMGGRVDHFSITVEGAPSSAVVEGNVDKVKLNPGTHAVVMLTITVPRSPESLAANYPVVVRAQSEDAPGESGVARSMWTVLPYVRYTLDVDPKRITVWNARTALYTVTLSNEGNAPDSYAFTFKEDEEKLRYHFIPRTVARDPGEGVPLESVVEPTTSPGPSLGPWPLPWRRGPRVPVASASARRAKESAIRLLVSAPWRLVGTKVDRPFTVEARAASDGSVQTVKGVLAQRALIPIWLPPVIWLLLAIVAAWLYIRTQPHVQVFDVIPTAVLPGGKAVVRYEVTNAQQVQIHIHPVDAQAVEPNPMVINQPRTKHLNRIVVTPINQLDTSYQVYASNGCMFGFCLHSDASNGPLNLHVLPTLTPTPAPVFTSTPPPKPTRPPAPPTPTPIPPPAVVPPAKPSTKPAPRPAPKPTAARVVPIPPAPHPAPKPTTAPKRASHKTVAASTATPRPLPRPTATLAPRPTLTPTPAPPRITPFLGTWANIVPRPADGNLIRLVVKKVNARTLSFHGYFACAGRECDGGTVKVSLAGKKKSAPLLVRFKVGQERISVRVRRVGGQLLHAQVIERINGCTMCPSGNDYLLRQPILPRPAITPIPSVTPTSRPGGQ